MVGCVLLPVALALCAGDEPWRLQESSSDARLRGVAAASDQVAWATGSAGTILRTEDGGERWEKRSIPGTADLDFRDVAAIGPAEAHVLAIGPGEASRIFRTTDAGATWTETFRMRDPKGFLDAIAFWDASRGIALGDPVGGHFTILLTSDGGRSWSTPSDLKMPAALANEGAFAASGTCLVTQGDRNAWFVTGGAGAARAFRTTDGGHTWRVTDLPIPAQSASSGAFSIAFASEHEGVAVGGDYQDAGAQPPFAAVTSDGGATWRGVVSNGPGGYRSAVIALSDRVFLSVGPGGADITENAGTSWRPLGDRRFHAVAVDRESGVVWAVGENGVIARRR